MVRYYLSSTPGANKCYNYLGNQGWHQDCKVEDRVDHCLNSIITLSLKRCLEAMVKNLIKEKILLKKKV